MKTNLLFNRITSRKLCVQLTQKGWWSQGLGIGVGKRKNPFRGLALKNEKGIENWKGRIHRKRLPNIYNCDDASNEKAIPCPSSTVDRDTLALTMQHLSMATSVIYSKNLWWLLNPPKIHLGLMSQAHATHLISHRPYASSPLQPTSSWAPNHDSWPQIMAPSLKPLMEWPTSLGISI